jgi:hypothetical protein
VGVVDFSEDDEDDEEEEDDEDLPSPEDGVARLSLR